MEVTAFEDAVAQALAEAEGAPDEGAEESGPLFDQAPPQAPDQATDAETRETDAGAETPAEDESLFGDVEVPQVPQTPQDLASQTFHLPGVEKPVSLQELKDGFLRQRDYTQKTQEVAAQRRQNEQAVKFWQALEADPVGVARTLAEHAGLVQKGAAPAVQVDLSPLRTQEQVEAEVNRRVAEAVSQHPAVLTAAAANARSWIEGQFVHLEELAGQKLTPKDRSVILRTAAAKGITDLEVVFNSLMAEKGRKQAAASTLRDVAPARQTSRAVTREVSEPADSFEEAARRASVQIATSTR